MWITERCSLNIQREREEFPHFGVVISIRKLEFWMFSMIFKVRLIGSLTYLRIPHNIVFPLTSFAWMDNEKEYTNNILILKRTFNEEEHFEWVVLVLSFQMFYQGMENFFNFTKMINKFPTPLPNKCSKFLPWEMTYKAAFYVLFCHKGKVSLMQSL